MIKTVFFKTRFILYIALLSVISLFLFNFLLARQSGIMYKYFIEKPTSYNLELEKWLDYLSGNKREEAYPGERSLYLRALVDSNTFNCNAAQKKALERTISEEEALQAGITFEKDFMLFLHDLKQHVVKESESTIDSLIEEELQHMREMFHLKEKLDRKK